MHGIGLVEGRFVWDSVLVTWYFIDCPVGFCQAHSSVLAFFNWSSTTRVPCTLSLEIKQRVPKSGTHVLYEHMGPRKRSGNADQTMRAKGDGREAGMV
jgi:hypothetical protein